MDVQIDIHLWAPLLGLQRLPRLAPSRDPMTYSTSLPCSIPSAFSAAPLRQKYQQTFYLEVPRLFNQSFILYIQRACVCVSVLPLATLNVVLCVGVFCFVVFFPIYTRSHSELFLPERRFHIHHLICLPFPSVGIIQPFLRCYHFSISSLLPPFF